jgi:hypothetical protein
LIILIILGEEYKSRSSSLSSFLHSPVTSSLYPCNRQWRPIGLWDVEDPTLSRQSAHS